MKMISFVGGAFCASAIFALFVAFGASGGSGHGSVRAIERGRANVFHDDARGVTCWEFGAGVSCYPDSSIARAAIPNDASSP